MSAMLRVGLLGSISWIVCSNAQVQGVAFTLGSHLLIQEQPKMTGDIRGVVTDSSGAVTSGAQVTLKGPAGGPNLTTTTNAQGESSFPGRHTQSREILANANS